MPKSTDPNNSFDAAETAPSVDRAPQAGDADAVQKTTWVVGKGTDDRAVSPDDRDDPSDRLRSSEV